MGLGRGSRLQLSDSKWPLASGLEQENALHQGGWQATFLAGTMQVQVSALLWFEIQVLEPEIEGLGPIASFADQCLLKGRDLLGKCTSLGCQEPSGQVSRDTTSPMPAFRFPPTPNSKLLREGTSQGRFKVMFGCFIFFNFN